jgi:hypothetical protein
VLDRADKIWNRACDSEWEPSQSGDRALQDVLRFHGLIRNGGLDFALEANLDAAPRAASGFRVLRAPALADVLDRAHGIASRAAVGAQFDVLHLDEDEAARLEALGNEYDEFLPTDSALDAIFRAYLAAKPEEFAPI